MSNKYDVAVVGLGTAGAIALIAAARLGLSAIGIERLNGMGGTGTVGNIKGYYFGSHGGLYEEINKKAESVRASNQVAPNIDAKLYVLEREAVLAGAQIQYETVVCDVSFYQTVKRVK